MSTGSEAFLELPVSFGFGPATGPTLKTALCHIRTLVRRRINNVTYVYSYDASLTWLVIRNALWVGKNCLQRNWLFRQSAVGVVLWRSLVTSPSFTGQSCGRCASFLKVSWFAFWIESSLSWKLVLCAVMWYRSWTDRNIVFLCLLGIMRVVIWMTRKKELYDDESFSSQTLVSFYKHQIKVKIRSERKRLSSLEFGKRWVTVARPYRVVGASLIFNQDIPGTYEFWVTWSSWPPPNPGKSDFRPFLFAQL